MKKKKWKIIFNYTLLKKQVFPHKHDFSCNCNFSVFPPRFYWIIIKEDYFLHHYIMFWHIKALLVQLNRINLISMTSAPDLSTLFKLLLSHSKWDAFQMVSFRNSLQFLCLCSLWDMMVIYFFHVTQTLLVK